MTTSEPGQGRVIWALVGRDNPERHIFDQTPLDPSGRSFANPVGVEQHAHHEGRVVGGAATTVLPIAGIEARQVELGQHVHQEPRQMALGQPVCNRRRQQEHLVPVGMTHVDRHTP